MPYVCDSLLKPLPGAATGDRRVWSIPLAAVWVPYFTSTNARAKTRLAPEVLGAPLRLAKKEDGSIRFNKAGKPVLRVVSEMNAQIRTVRENLVSDLLADVAQTQKTHAAEFKAQVEAAQKAGAVILDAQVREVMALIESEEGEAPESIPTGERELVPAA